MRGGMSADRSPQSPTVVHLDRIGQRREKVPQQATVECRSALARQGPIHQHGFNALLSEELHGSLGIFRLGAGMTEIGDLIPPREGKDQVQGPDPLAGVRRIRKLFVNNDDLLRHLSFGHRRGCPAGRNSSRSVPVPAATWIVTYTSGSHGSRPMLRRVSVPAMEPPSTKSPIGDQGRNIGCGKPPKEQRRRQTNEDRPPRREPESRRRETAFPDVFAATARGRGRNEATGRTSPPRLSRGA